MYNLLSAALLFYLMSSGNAQDTNKTWTIGMDLQFFITSSDDIAACPSTLQDANSSSQVSPIFSSTNVTSGRSSAGPGVSASFSLTNGWLKSTPFDSTSQTMIRATEPAATGGNCWYSELGTNIISSRPCGTDRRFQFYLETNTEWPNYLWDCDLNIVTRPGEGGGPLTVTPSSAPNMCVYDSLTGLPVIAPEKNYHFTMAEITNLTDVSIPQTPAIEAELPVCNSDGIDELGAVDCAVAKAVNGLPAGCASDPSSVECILHLAPAFCSDIPAIRMGSGNASEEIENCLLAIPEGPCVANPGGAACISGLFPGIKFVVGSGGSVSVGKRDITSFLKGSGSFFIGVFKSLVNAGVGLVDAIVGDGADPNKIICLALSKIKKFPEPIASTVNEGCEIYLFKRQGITPPFEYKNNIEQAGGLVADIASLVIPAVDLAKEVEIAGFLERLLAKFATKNAPEVLVEGEFLEAAVVGKEGEVVRIFKDGGDGTIAGLSDDVDVESLTDSIKETGFQNCKVPPTAGITRRATEKDIICKMVPSVVENPDELAPRRAPARRRTVDGLVEAPSITEDEKTLLKELSDDFHAYYTSFSGKPVAADEVTMAFYNADEAGVDYEVIAKKARGLYGIGADEEMAIRRWANEHEINAELLRSGCSQIDGLDAPVLRYTDLDPDQIVMLDTAGVGVRSNGPPGIYEQQDLSGNLYNKVVGISGTAPAIPREVMSATLKKQTLPNFSAKYMFIIQSKSGRYIHPLVAEKLNEHEVVFLNKISGKFKLLGRHDLNGGAAAKAAGKPGPYAVYYFEETDTPTVLPRICDLTVSSNCRPAILKPPTFP